MNRNIAIGLSVSAFLGAVIWSISPLVTGALEPWDADSPYYFVSLFIAGAIIGFLCPRHAWVVLPGIVFGQLFYILSFLPLGPLVPLGVIFMAGYGVLSLLGALLASRVRRNLQGTRSGGEHGA